MQTSINLTHFKVALKEFPAALSDACVGPYSGFKTNSAFVSGGRKVSCGPRDHPSPFQPETYYYIDMGHSYIKRISIKLTYMHINL
jgi:hypothetical protein